MCNMKLSDILGRVDPSWIASGSVVIGGERGLGWNQGTRSSVNGILGVGWEDQMTRERASERARGVHNKCGEREKECVFVSRRQDCPDYWIE